MTVSPALRKLIDATAPLWAGEAEVVRTYWTSPVRTRETDLRWLRAQCRKEFWDSFADPQKGLFLEPLDRLRAAFPKIDIEVDRHAVLDLAEMFLAEFSHYVAFADAYDAIRGEGDEPMNPHALRDLAEWPENAELGRIRAEHRRLHGDLGLRACEITEGGYCALFAEGMKLAGRGGADEAIAAACRAVFDDEFGHMLRGILNLDEENLGPADWDLLERLVREQMQARIHMRNAQFDYPLSQARIEEIFAGRIEPLAFDYERAQLS
ncbi:MAG TPA: hypothetical protein VFY49_07710 [Myxococcota bacterium]|nr:hypothetical protein [Myxococcota bacterium]